MSLQKFGKIELPAVIQPTLSPEQKKYQKNLQDIIANSPELKALKGIGRTSLECDSIMR